MTQPFRPRMVERCHIFDLAADFEMVRGSSRTLGCSRQHQVSMNPEVTVLQHRSRHFKGQFLLAKYPNIWGGLASSKLT
jgi:hypothetical protein